MNKKNWKKRFTDEFGIHFSASELQFVIAFIEEEIDEAYKRGQLSEIEANATADITIAKEKVEQIRMEAYNLGYQKGKAYRDAIEGSIPQSMIDQQVVLAEQEGYNAGLADGTGKPLLAIEQIREEVRREERAFILNVLDGIDIADGECNTKAIRECLKARVV